MSKKSLVNLSSHFCRVGQTNRKAEWRDRKTGRIYIFLPKDTRWAGGTDERDGWVFFFLFDVEIGWRT